MTVRRFRILLVGVVIVISLVNLATITQTPFSLAANVGITLGAAFLVWRICSQERSR